MSPMTKGGESIDLLPVGTRIRHRNHGLTGTIKAHEWNNIQNRIISPIPYLIGWDDSERAADLLGWFFVYASNESVEPTDD